MIKLLVILLLMAIIASLFSGLFYMFRKKDQVDDRMVKALTIRVGLSVTLFALLMLLFYTGVIPPEGIRAL
ncbi:MAG: twin transmembrane helix small protein [Gammaproteobacteria bacterium]|nr:twin transmembrane helix small protein [Gammaproteobacteria bacterium]